MARGSKLRGDMGGNAIYVWTIGECLRDIRAADRILHDGGITYHREVNNFLALVSDDIGYYTGDWAKWQATAFFNAQGDPLGPRDKLTRAHRRMELGRALGMLRRKGIMGFPDRQISNDLTDLAAAMDEERDDDETEEESQP